MNESDRRKLKHRISARLEELADADRLGEASQVVVEPDQQMAGRLPRMDEGEDGFCEVCGEDTAPKRLELDPAALKCICCVLG